MLAEKLETREAHNEAVEAGYRFFQGYFFSRPVIVSARNVPAFRMNYLRLLQEVTDPDVTSARLEDDRQAGPLDHLPAAASRQLGGLRLRDGDQVAAPRADAARTDEIRRWASVWAMADLSRDTPGELVVESVFRGRFCELLAASTVLRTRASELFLMGLFSHLDAIMGRPLEEILSALPVPHDVRDALLGEPNLLRQVLDTVVAYEAADWERCAASAAAAGLSEEDLPDDYLRAAEWTHQIFASHPHLTGNTAD